MCREVNQRKFSKATLARLGSVILLVVFAAPHLTAVAEDVTYSKLWGRNGELWSPTSRLPDFSYAGYSRGEHPLRALKADVSVKQFGAIGDGEADDTPYKGHSTELGYNAIAMRGVRNCWVRNIRIHNADSGMFISGNNITLREISLTSERPRERQRKATFIAIRSAGEKS